MAYLLVNLRGLDACSSDRGTFTVLALDHRQKLEGPLPADPTSVTEAEMVAFKRAVVRALGRAGTRGSSSIRRSGSARRSRTGRSRAGPGSSSPLRRPDTRGCWCQVLARPSACTWRTNTFVPVVIADRRQDRCIGGQCDGGKRLALHRESADELGSEMLGIGGRYHRFRKQDLAPGLQALCDYSGRTHDRRRRLLRQLNLERRELSRSPDTTWSSPACVSIICVLYVCVAVAPHDLVALDQFLDAVAGPSRA